MIHHINKRTKTTWLPQKYKNSTWKKVNIHDKNSHESGYRQVIVIVQLPSRVWLSVTPWTAAHQISLSFAISLSLLKLMSIESVMPPNHLILCHPFLLLPSIFPSIRVFSSESALCVMWPKYWSFSISSSNECSGLITFRMDWFDILAVQGTFKSLQHYNLKALILQCSAFFMVQISHPYMTTGESFDFMDLCQQSDASAF